MKKRFVILNIIALALLSGCASVEIQTKDTTERRVKYDSLCNDFIDALKSENAEKMSTLICDDIKDMHDVPAELSEMFDHIDGYVVSYSDYTQTTSEGDSYRQGKCVNHHVNVKFNQIKTDKDETYRLSFYANLINSADQSKVGIEFIRVIDENGEEYLVGEYIDG